MRLRVSCCLLAFAFVLTACGGGKSSSYSPLTSTQAGAQQMPSAPSRTTQSATSFVTNIIAPVSIAVFVPCAAGGNGEVITLSGNLHELITTTITANNIHTTEHFNPQGITGVGSAGDKYQGTGVTRQNVNVANAGFPGETTFVNNFRIIGQGPGNNFLVHENTHLTINANGTVTANQSNFSIDCK